MDYIIAWKVTISSLNTTQKFHLSFLLLTYGRTHSTIHNHLSVSYKLSQASTSVKDHA
ncbi:hypothetical protein HanIR_Chr08g0381751 [Helianthus annuus]|nr:hypothetical protein HanIR_Chr08g0381751 [Helianthus annuus]